MPYVPQNEISECGAACLAMVLAHHGKYVPLAELREACGVSRDGSSARGIATAAERYQLAFHAYQAEPEDLQEIPLPAILHWEFNHWVVLERLTAKGGDLVDPAFGHRRVTTEQLHDAFTGVVLAFEPAADFLPQARRRPSIERYAAILRAALPNVVQIIAASLVLECVALVTPVVTMLIVDRVIVPKQAGWVLALGIALVLSIAVREITTIVRSWVVDNLQTAFDIALTSEFVEHVLRLPPAFFQQRHPGDLLQRIASNAAMRDFFSSVTVTALLDSLLLAGYTGLMFLYDVRLALVVLFFGVVRAALLLLMRDRFRQIVASQLAAAGGDSAALVELLSTIEVTKGSGGEAAMVNRWVDRRVETLNQVIDQRRLTARFNMAMLALDGLTLAAVLWLGGREILAGTITLGVFTALLTLQAIYAKPLQAALGAALQMETSLRHLERLDDVLKTPVERIGGIDPGRLQGRITLNHVSFRYTPNGSNTIDDVSLDIAPGEMVALVGRSGSGKSTLAALISGTLSPDKGVVSFDERPLDSLDLAKVRPQIGVVLQEIALFDDSVRSNVSLNNREQPLEQVRDATRQACVGDVIDTLPLGYDTYLGQNGNTLSGGQRQRIALSRALAVEPSILVLDEATRSQDSEIEQRITRNLEATGCTRIVVAHRLSTIARASRIFVIENGRIVQVGTYPELCAQEGPFQSLVEAARNSVAGMISSS